MTVRDTPLARQHDVPGYYVRVAPAEVLAAPEASAAIMPIRNRRDDLGLRGDEQIGTEFLQLVRFGLRRADDPLIRGSLRLADALIRTDTPTGPVWHRYRGDGYGEHEDGSAYDGTGCGRGWPLLTGERGHYELCAGSDPLPLLEAMAAMASPGGMLPEQVWDADPIPTRRLFPGHPSGSAMPLAWAHAEFVKLVVSRHVGHPVDQPRAVWQRYRGRPAAADYAFWWPHAPIGSFSAGVRLAIALPEPAIVHWSADGWTSTEDTATSDTGLGFYVAVLATTALPEGGRIDFTWRRQNGGEWVGRDYAIGVVSATGAAPAPVEEPDPISGREVTAKGLAPGMRCRYYSRAKPRGQSRGDQPCPRSRSSRPEASSARNWSEPPIACSRMKICGTLVRPPARDTISPRRAGSASISISR